jgi:hypothetical protein
MLAYWALLIFDQMTFLVTHILKDISTEESLQSRYGIHEPQATLPMRRNLNFGGDKGCYRSLSQK